VRGAPADSAEAAADGGSPSGLTWRHVLVEPAREQEPQEFLMDRVAEGGGGPQNSSVLTADQQLISPLEQ